MFPNCWSNKTRSPTVSQQVAKTSSHQASMFCGFLQNMGMRRRTADSQRVALGYMLGLCSHQRENAHTVRTWGDWWKDCSGFISDSVPTRRLPLRLLGIPCCDRFSQTSNCFDESHSQPQQNNQPHRLVAIGIERRAPEPRSARRTDLRSSSPRRCRDRQVA